jgi:hypothetical protein
MNSHSFRRGRMLLVIGCLIGVVPGVRASGQDSALNRQPDEQAASVAADFDYFVNNWNVIGLKDYVHGTRITPDNQLLLADNAHVQICLGSEHRPLSRENPKRALHGWMPIIVVTADDGPVHYEITFWATPLPSAADWSKAFDWPTEGENFLNWIVVKATNTGDAPAEAITRIAPYVPAPAAAQAQNAPENDKSLSQNYNWSWRLAPRESAEDAACYTFFPADSPNTYEKNSREWLQRTEEYWQHVVDGAAKIEVPCRKANEALLAAHVCQLIASDHGEVHGGEGFYDEFYIRDGAYQVMELEEAGFAAAAAKVMERYLVRQRDDGRFESQAGQFDANGQAVWTLWQYYRITNDREFLARVYPAMRRAVEWTKQARRSTAAPFTGVLPAAVSDGESLWEGKHHIVGYDLWNLRGMLCTADAAKRLDKPADAKEILAEAAAYRQDIDAAWQKTGVPHFPPSWEGAGTHWGNTETLWPTELFERDNPRVAALCQFVREQFAGGFIEGTIQWKGNGNVQAIHPYMGAYTTMTDLVRGQHEQVVEDFYWYLLHSTAAHAFPEGIYYKKRTAWSDTIPHVTGACNYAIMLRHMLVHETGDDLHLLSAVPDWWLGAGQEIRIERLPTHFGEMNLIVRGTNAGVEVKFDPPKRNPPRQIVLTLPKSRPLVGSLSGVQVAERPDQRKRWDFPTIVAHYLETYDWSKPNAVSLSTGKPATCSHWLSTFNAQLANDGRSDDTESYWATDVEQHPGNAWWQVDLEKPTTISRVVVVGFFGDERYYGFTVETSLDGQAWDVVADWRDNKKLSTPEGYTCRFDPRAARYVRVTQTLNSANTGRHLVEVMVYEQ